MKIFLAGATGAIGRPLLAMLLQDGHEVTAMTSHPEKTDLLLTYGARPVLLDVFNREGVLDVIQAAKPDVIIDQLTNLRTRDYEANSRIRSVGTRNLVDGALSAGVPRFIAQSYPIYAPGKGPACEEDAFDIESPAARRTIAGVMALENMVAEMPRWVILRCATFYGPGTWYSRTGEIGDQARRGELIATGAITSFIQVEDAARAALLALDWPTGIYNIADSDPAPGTEWVPVFSAQVGAPPPPMRSEEGGGRGISNEKARRDLGWQPNYPSWRQGFQTALG